MCRDRRSEDTGHIGDQNRQHDDEGGAEEGAKDAAQPTDDHHEQNLEGAVDVETLRLHRAKIEKYVHCAGDPAIERADREGDQFGAQQVDPDDLGGNIHVAHRHPGPADRAAHQVLHQQRENDDDRQGEHVARLGALDRHAEQKDLGRRDHPRGGIIGEPAEMGNHPFDKEMRAQRRHREIEPLDTERRKPKKYPHRCRHQAGKDEHDRRRQIRHAGGEFIGGECSHRHEARGPERYLAAIAQQNVEPHRRHRQDEEGDQHRMQQIFRGDQRHDEHDRQQRRDNPPAILTDREDRLIGGIARFVLAGLAVEHS